MREQWQGTTWRETHVACGMEGCDQEDAARSLAHLRALGWRKRQGVGWVCPECAKQQRGDGDALG